MPVHPEIASKFHLLEGIVSFEAAFADPALRARLDEFMSVTGAPRPPQVATRDDAAPGPHGPVPVRVYLPVGDVLDRPAPVWVQAAPSGSATSTCPRPTGPRATWPTRPARSS